MKIYLVGGAVRDKLLGLPVKEKDWVVVGASVDDMRKRGFKPVGKDFPVFLHPESNEEYALARIERKMGRGYAGFDFNASAQVSLEEDLKRRDLTINAMAESPEGTLIDPYHGKNDLEKRILRHVSPAFVEDPVRILRAARFAARYTELGFKVAEETNELMKTMVASGEVDALVAERVWKEFERALKEKNPEQFFHVLDNCGALAKLFPELQMAGLGMQTLIQAAQCAAGSQVRFAALLHDLPEAKVKAICQRFRVPTDYKELALLASSYLSLSKDATHLSSEALLDLLRKLDAFRRQERFKKFLLLCELVSPAASKWLLDVYQAASHVDVALFMAQGFIGKDLANKIDEERLQNINNLKSK